MTRRTALILEVDHMLVVPAQAGRTTHTVAWSPGNPGESLEALRHALRQSGGPPRDLLLIVGLGFLEPVRHGLPPVSVSVRQQMLRADRDRFFVCGAEVATAVDGEWAVAVDAALLHLWWDTLTQVAPVRAVLALPEAVRLAGMVGAWQVGAGPGEHGLIIVAERGLTEVRRSRAIPADVATPLDVAACARGLLGLLAIPMADQLLDARLEQSLASRERRRIGRSGLLAASALLALAWAANDRQARTLAKLETERARLEVLAAPALAAQQRLLKASEEHRLLDLAAQGAHSAAAPLAVLARLGSLVPSDAFVQRLEWNGLRWRIDGSAGNASRLIPLLDADSVFAEVQSLAPSTRFLDAGQARSSFSIGFRVGEGVP